MKKFLTTITLMFIIAIIGLSAYYALGIFGDDSSKPVEKQEYLTGNFLYSGELKYGHFNGNGLIDFQNGESYVGVFTDGRLDGEGIFDVANEQNGFWRFVGVFENGTVRNGTFYLSDGETIVYERNTADDSITGQGWQYIGDFSVDNQHCTGTFVFKDSSVFSGSFSHGLASGEGTYTDSSGIVIYTGGFKDGLFSGQGKYFSSAGWSYEGGFKDGLFDGEGVITTETATIRGIWEKGVQIERHE